MALEDKKDFDPPELTARVAGNIRRWRKERRITQRELSLLVRGGDTYISTVENTPRMPSFLMAMRICRHLAIEPNQLLEPLPPEGVE
jgi:transcriptional regulator with XRE-family HTH domain